MTEYQLNNAINRFTYLVLDLPDGVLERDWAWGSYDSEGVRFAFFRVYEQLQDLANLILQERVEFGHPQTGAQRYLTRYHGAYLDLQAVLLGVSSQLADQVPAEGEWSLRRTVAHMVGADLGFYVVIKFSLDRHRGGLDPLVEIDDEQWLHIADIDENKLDAIMVGSLEGLRAYHHNLHTRILTDFASISPAELQMPSRYWEDEPMSLEFRLGRLDSHIRQHIVQIEKTRVILGIQLNEAQRLLRLIYAALAEVGGARLGAPGTSSQQVERLANQIDSLTEELRPILA
jgi:hypothetical protein